MPDYFDARENRDPAARERDLAARLPDLVAAALCLPGWHRHLGEIDAREIRSRADLAQLPLLRKSALPEMQRQSPPFAGLVAAGLAAASLPAAGFAADGAAIFGRWFSSPGPIAEPEGRHDDPWRSARSLFAAGFRRTDIVLNTFSYHLTPGGFILDAGARAVGCTVIPAGPGNTEQQLDVIARLRPTAYTGTPDFLKILLDAATAAGRDATSIRRAAVSGAAFPPSLQAEIRTRGIDAYQSYATADVGVIAYETAARAGLVVNEDLVVEIVRPGTGDPVPDGEVGEVVVTSFDHERPWIRLALGDLSAVLPGPSPCGRTNQRLRGWLGRADQTTKVKGMFIRPEQVAEIGRRHPQVGRLRIVVGRVDEVDVLTLKAETGERSAALAEALGASLRAVTKLSGAVELAAAGALPNDGKVIEDIRGAAG